MGHGYGWGGMWFGWLFWIVLVGLIVWAVVALSRRGRPPVSQQNPDEDALDILKKRYAAGEISKEEFEEKKKDLIRE